MARRRAGQGGVVVGPEGAPPGSLSSHGWDLRPQRCDIREGGDVDRVGSLAAHSVSVSLGPPLLDRSLLSLLSLDSLARWASVSLS